MKESPVRKLDMWIEKHNCAIEYYAGNPNYPWQQMIRPAIDLLSDVVEFFNGRLIKEGTLAQSGRASGR